MASREEFDSLRDRVENMDKENNARFGNIENRLNLINIDAKLIKAHTDELAELKEGIIFTQNFQQFAVSNLEVSKKTEAALKKAKIMVEPDIVEEQKEDAICITDFFIMKLIENNVITVANKKTNKKKEITFREIVLNQEGLEEHVSSSPVFDKLKNYINGDIGLLEQSDEFYTQSGKIILNYIKGLNTPAAIKVVNSIKNAHNRHKDELATKSEAEAGKQI